jgi:hypothetical protein
MEKQSVSPPVESEKSVEDRGFMRGPFNSGTGDQGGLL